MKRTLIGTTTIFPLAFRVTTWMSENSSDVGVCSEASDSRSLRLLNRFLNSLEIKDEPDSSSRSTTSVLE